MFFITRLFILLSCFTLIGCSYLSNPFQNRDKEYLSAKSIPPMRIPPGVSSDAFQSYYPVSDRPYSERAKDVSIVPPGLYT